MTVDMNWANLFCDLSDNDMRIEMELILNNQSSSLLINSYSKGLWDFLLRMMSL